MVISLFPLERKIDNVKSNSLKLKYFHRQMNILHCQVSYDHDSKYSQIFSRQQRLAGNKESMKKLAEGKFLPCSILVERPGNFCVVPERCYCGLRFFSKSFFLQRHILQRTVNKEVKITMIPRVTEITSATNVK